VEGRMPSSLESRPSCQTLSNACSTSRKGCSAILSKLKGGCHSIHHSVTLMDCGVLGPEAKLVVWDNVLAF
jgi:hypothetical protein